MQIWKQEDYRGFQLGSRDRSEVILEAQENEAQSKTQGKLAVFYFQQSQLDGNRWSKKWASQEILHLAEERQALKGKFLDIWNNNILEKNTGGVQRAVKSNARKITGDELKACS